MTDYLAHPIGLDTPDFASAFDELSFWASRFGAMLFEHIELQRGIHILDVGCGTGFPLIELAHVCGPSCRLTGVDIWKEGLERGEMKRRVYGLENLQLVNADAAHLPFEPNTSECSKRS
jgi:ubiquinone/menaquinone biosynthesis C-methylase UbiE